MPGGSDETGNSASVATNSGVVTPVAVEAVSYTHLTLPTKRIV